MNLSKALKKIKQAWTEAIPNVCRHVQLSFNSIGTRFHGWYFLSKCLYFLVSVIMEKMMLFKSTQKKVKIKLVKSMHYLTDLTSYLSKSSGQLLLFIRFYMLAIFCQVPNTKSVPSCLMLNLGSFKNTKTVIIAISGLKTMEMRKDYALCVQSQKSGQKKTLITE